MKQNNRKNYKNNMISTENQQGITKVLRCYYCHWPIESKKLLCSMRNSTINMNRNRELIWSYTDFVLTIKINWRRRKIFEFGKVLRTRNYWEPPQPLEISNFVNLNWNLKVSRSVRVSFVKKSPPLYTHKNRMSWPTFSG